MLKAKQILWSPEMEDLSGYDRVESSENTPNIKEDFSPSAKPPVTSIGLKLSAFQILDENEIEEHVNNELNDLFLPTESTLPADSEAITIPVMDRASVIESTYHTLEEVRVEMANGMDAAFSKMYMGIYIKHLSRRLLLDLSMLSDVNIYNVTYETVLRFEVLRP